MMKKPQKVVGLLCHFEVFYCIESIDVNFWTLCGLNCLKHCVTFAPNCYALALRSGTSSNAKEYSVINSNFKTNLTALSPIIELSVLFIKSE